MGRGKAVYPQGTLSKAILRVIDRWHSDVFDASNIVEVVHRKFPKASVSSINNYLTYYLRKQGVVEKIAKGRFRRVKVAVSSEATHKLSDLPKSGEEEISALDIGKGVVEYVNRLKAKIVIVEEEKVVLDLEVITLMKQINDLQGAFNAMKLNGGVTVKEIFD